MIPSWHSRTDPKPKTQCHLLYVPIMGRSDRIISWSSTHEYARPAMRDGLQILEFVDTNQIVGQYDRAGAQ